MRSIDVDEAGAQWLPFALTMTERLHKWLSLTGLEFGKRNYMAPDGVGKIYIRSLRVKHFKAGSIIDRVDDTYDTDVWQDHIRIEGSEPGGYIVRPYVRRISTGVLTLPAEWTRLRIPYTRADVEAFPDYEGLSRTPHVAGARITTAASHSVDGPGVFQGAKFSLLTAPAVDGVFAHSYIDANGDAQRKLLSAYNSGSLFQFKDSLTDVVLSESGGSSNTLVTYTVGRDGKHVVFEAAEGITSAKINYAATTQVVKSAITDTTPYGTTTRTYGFSGSPYQYMEPDNLDPLAGAYRGSATRGNTGIVTSPLTRGVLDADTVAVATVTNTYAENSSSYRELAYTSYGLRFPNTFTIQGDDGLYLGWWVAGGVGIMGTQYLAETTPFTPQNGEVYEMTFSDSSMIVLNNGSVSKTFPLRSGTGQMRKVTFAEPTFLTTPYQPSSAYLATDVFDTATYTGTRNYSTGELRIVYCDPTVPVVVYEYIKTTVSFSGSGSAERRVTDQHPDVRAVVGGAALYSAGSGTYTTTTTISLEVGILIGARSQVLFEEIGVPDINIVTQDTYSSAFTGAYFEDLDGNDDRGIDVTAANSSSSTPTNVNTAPYKKKLKTVYDVNFDSYINAKYSVDVRDTKNWLLGVWRPVDIDGATVNRFNVYSGRLGNGATQAVLDALAAGFGGDPDAVPPVAPTDAQAALDFAAGSVSGYEIRLHFEPADTLETRYVGSFI